MPSAAAPRNLPVGNLNRFDGPPAALTPDPRATPADFGPVLPMGLRPEPPDSAIASVAPTATRPTATAPATAMRTIELRLAWRFSVTRNSPRLRSAPRSVRTRDGRQPSHDPERRPGTTQSIG